ncbi:hypothetical protein VFA_003568 [Vibrio furnissii CIP 102972]|nr:hypothetical protein VFA_003568 [Vibrio furnissii CIP 102972]
MELLQIDSCAHRSYDMVVPQHIVAFFVMFVGDVCGDVDL